MQNGRHEWLNRVHDRIADGRLDPRAGYVAYVLAVRYANGSNEAWPSQPTLARSTGLSQRTVRAALDDLERQGLLSRRKGHPARTNGDVYTLSNAATIAALGGTSTSVTASEPHAQKPFAHRLSRA